MCKICALGDRLHEKPDFMLVLNGLFEYLKLIFFPKLIQFHPI